MAEAEPSTRKFSPAFIFSIAIGVIYGVFVRLSFSQDFSQGVISTLSIGFMTLVPLAMGALTVFFYERRVGRLTYANAFIQSLRMGFVFLLVVGVLAFELLICLVMATPFFTIIAGVGGMVMLWVLRMARRRTQYKNSPNVVLVILLFAPYFVSPLERMFTPQALIHTVETMLVINATPQTIWQNIIRVPEITSDEQRPSLFQLLGVPRPIEATLNSEGVGGLRYGIFADGVAFNETITLWQPDQAIAFDIVVDTKPQQGGIFSEIGGPFFDVLGASYELEPLGNGQVVLHLSGTYRLTTNFNGYGQLWIDLIMGDFQNYILSVVKARAEKIS